MSLTQPRPDGGWGWVVVGCSVINHVCTVGLMLSLSVLFVSWIDHFGAGKGETSLILSVGIACMFGLCPLPAHLASRYGFRAVGVCGGLLTCTGLVASSFATSIKGLVVSVGLLTGLGCCFCYLPAVAVVALYFEKRRCLAMGIATSGTGIGAFGLAPLVSYLEASYGWRGALVVLGGLCLNTCVTAMMLRPLEEFQQRQRTDASEDLRSESETDAFADDPAAMQIRETCQMKRDKCDDATVSHSHLDNAPCVNRTTSRLVPGDKGSVSKEDVDIPLSYQTDTPHQHLLATTDIDFQENKSCYTSTNEYNSNSEKDKFLVNSHLSFASCNENRPFVSLGALNSRTPTDIRPKHHRSLNTLKTSNFVCEDTRYVQLIHSLSRTDSPLLGSIQSILTESKKDNKVLTDSEDFEPQRKTSTGNISGRLSKILSSPTFQANLDILRNKSFLLFAVSNFLNNLAFMTCVVHLVDRAVYHGIDKSVGAIFISVQGLGNIFGRLFFGWMADGVCSNRLLMYISSVTICGVGTMLSTMCGDMVVLHGAYAVFIGASMGIYVVLCSLVTVDLTGVSRVATAYGLIMFFIAPATVMGAPFAGWLYDLTQTYLLSYLVNGAFFLASGLMLVPLLCIGITSLGSVTTFVSLTSLSCAIRKRIPLVALDEALTNGIEKEIQQRTHLEQDLFSELLHTRPNQFHLCFLTLAVGGSVLVCLTTSWQFELNKISYY